MKSKTVLKILSLVLALMMVLVVAVGCDDGSGNPGALIDRPDNEKPASSVEGYFASNQLYHGGTDVLDINLNQMTVAREDQDVVIHMKFVEGSTPGGQEEVAAKGVPRHVIRCLPEPNRLIVHLDNITYYDYYVESGIGRNEYVQSLYRQVRRNDSGQYETSLVFNLREDTAYKIEETVDSLVIRLRSIEPAREENWFVSINAYPEYENGIFPSDSGFSSTMCSDLNARLMISQPFESEEKATEFMNSEPVKMIMEGLLNRECKVISLRRAQLPEYNYAFDFDQLKNAQILKKDGGEVTALPVVAMGGRWLCSGPNGQELYAKNDITAEGEGTAQEYYSEQLWVTDADGQEKKITDIDFYLITQAVFSPDGKRVAFIDSPLNMGNSYRTVYILDLTNGQLINASEEGMYMNACGLAWQNNDRLFSMTGLEGEHQIMVYDFTKDQGKRAGVFDERPGAEGHMAILGDKLYYSDTQNGTIYQVSLTDQTRSEFAKGMNFVISADGKKMAYSREKEDSAALLSLIVRDMESGEETTVVSDVNVWTFRFCGSSSKLYYTVYNEAADEDYPMELYVTDLAQPAPKLLGRLVQNAVIDTMADQTCLLIAVHSEILGISIGVTYKMSLS